MSTPRASLKLFSVEDKFWSKVWKSGGCLNYALHGLSIEEGMVIRDALLPLLDAEPEQGVARHQRSVKVSSSEPEPRVLPAPSVRQG